MTLAPPSAATPPAYRIIERIGEGAFSTVYRAVQTSVGRDVALKLLRDEAGGTALRRFVREAQALARLEHPHIVRIFDFGVYRGRGYLATEILARGTLRTLLESCGHLSVPRAVNLVLQVLDALTFMHARGIVHRDLKPDNVLLADTGGVRVADLGMALVDGATANSGRRNVLGTVHYMAPEIFLELAYSESTDVYAAGIVLLELVTGRVPTAGMRLDAVLRAKVDAGSIACGAGGEALPTGLRAILERALASDPELRFRSAAAFAAALRDAPGLAGRGAASCARAGGRRSLASFAPSPPAGVLACGFQRVRRQLIRLWRTLIGAARSSSSTAWRPGAPARRTP